MNLQQQILQSVQKQNMLMEQLIGLLSEKDAQWVKTEGALRILRKGNYRILRQLRMSYLGNGGFRKEGKEYEYNVEQLRRIRQRMDAGEIKL